MSVAGVTTAIEAKRIGNWAKSIYNPNSWIRLMAFARHARDKIMQQMRTYVDNFDQVVYHTNSVEYAEYLRAIARWIGATNVTVTITP